MSNLRLYYETACLGEKDLVETNNKNKILLEYYGEKRHVLKRAKLKTFYGITIKKKEYENNRVICEKSSIKKISTNESKIKSIIEVLKKYKVTPIALNDVITDLLKTPEFQEN